MVKITILSYKSRKYATVFDWLIRLWTVSKYSHSEIIIGTSRYASIPNKGVCKINKNIVDSEAWDKQEFTVTKEQADKAKEFIKAQLGKKYDWKAIFLTFIFPFKSHTSNKWFCSELVAATINTMGMSLRFNRPSRVHPKKLYNTVKRYLNEC